MRRLIYCLLICSVAVSVNAANWLELDNNIYIDADSVSIFNKNTQVVTAFFKDVNMSSLKLTSKNKIVDSMRSKTAFNCKDETGFVLSLIEYDSKNTPINIVSLI